MSDKVDHVYVRRVKEIPVELGLNRNKSAARNRPIAEGDQATWILHFCLAEPTSDPEERNQEEIHLASLEGELRRGSYSNG